MTKRSRVALLLVAIALLLGGLIYGSMSAVQAECELCVEFNGLRECRTGSGTTSDEARRAAQRAACAVMAGGMSETIACQNRRPTMLQCG
jgi:hypothetical protein